MQVAHRDIAQMRANTNVQIHLILLDFLDNFRRFHNNPVRSARWAWVEKECTYMTYWWASQAQSVRRPTFRKSPLPEKERKSPCASATCTRCRWAECNTQPYLHFLRAMVELYLQSQCGSSANLSSLLHKLFTQSPSFRFFTHNLEVDRIPLISNDHDHLRSSRSFEWLLNVVMILHNVFMWEMFDFGKRRYYFLVSTRSRKTALHWHT